MLGKPPIPKGKIQDKQLHNKYGFDIFIISGSYGSTEDKRWTHDGPRMTDNARVWNKPKKVNNEKISSKNHLLDRTFQA